MTRFAARTRRGLRHDIEALQALLDKRDAENADLRIRLRNTAQQVIDRADEKAELARKLAALDADHAEQARQLAELRDEREQLLTRIRGLEHAETLVAKTKEHFGRQRVTAALDAATSKLAAISADRDRLREPLNAASPTPCPWCGSEVRAEHGYVPGATGMPVPCGNDWHDDDAAQTVTDAATPAADAPAAPRAGDRKGPRRTGRPGGAQSDGGGK